jgi:hypothetical protein
MKFIYKYMDFSEEESGDEEYKKFKRIFEKDIFNVMY